MKLAALLAGTALVLVPAAPAVAGETGSGKALGNCKNSSQGGVRAPLLPEVGHGKGNGGLVGVTGCVAPDPTPVDGPVGPPDGDAGDTIGGGTVGGDLEV